MMVPLMKLARELKSAGLTLPELTSMVALDPRPRRARDTCSKAVTLMDPMTPWAPLLTMAQGVGEEVCGASRHGHGTDNGATRVLDGLIGGRDPLRLPRLPSRFQVDLLGQTLFHAGGSHATEVVRGASGHHVVVRGGELGWRDGRGSDLRYPPAAPRIDAT